MRTSLGSLFAATLASLLAPTLHASAGHVIATDAGHVRSKSTTQRWEATFDARGFGVAPNAQSWSWGLRLRSYGIEGQLSPVGTSAVVRTDGQRVGYAWDANLEEWFVDRPAGIEHGFTLQHRPEGSAAGSLVFALDVLGGLAGRVDADGRGVCFRDDERDAALTYRGLTVFDATGATFPARMNVDSSTLEIRVEDSGAVYPLTVDPVVQRAYLKASNAELEDQFGSAIALSGNTLVVAAEGDDSSATAPGGDEADNSKPESGAVYVFVETAGVWTQEAFLKASNSEAADRFGAEVAIDGDTLVVSSAREASNATGVNGDQSDNSAAVSGAVYVFTRSGTTWTQEAYLKASNTDANDFFGSALAISGDRIVVGASGEDSSSVGVNGNEGNDSSPQAGAAYVFVRSAGTWSQEAYLKALHPDSSDLFGVGVAIDGTTLVVGAVGEDSSATGVGGDASSNSSSSTGAAYVFEHDGSSWFQSAYLKASNTGFEDSFGGDVDIDGDRIIVGAGFEDGGSFAINGDPDDNSASASGAAYIFERVGGAWQSGAYLKAKGGSFGDVFGGAVRISGDVVLVGASFEDSATSGINGDPTDESLTLAGSAYVFAYDGREWVQQAYLKASDTSTNEGPIAGDRFGRALDIDGDTLVVGAPFEDGGSVGIGGDPSDDSVRNTGAAYVFERPCTALLASTQEVRVGSPPNPSVFEPTEFFGPSVGAVWFPSIDHTSFATDATLDVALVGLGATNLTLPGAGTLLCNLVPTPALYATEPGAAFEIEFPANCGLVGFPFCVQGASLVPGGYSFTNALDITTGTY